jgi:integron integrase
MTLTSAIRIAQPALYTCQNMNHKPKLLDQVRHKIRLKHYSIRTEQAYVDWIKRFILFHHKRHPVSMGAPEVEAFLTHLAVERQVSASTQRQALSAIVFLYREILERDFGWLEDMERAKRPERLPVVLSRAEARAVLARLDGQAWLMASLLYGSGLRLMECVRLRIKDVDFAYRQILVRDGKGQKDRMTMLPQIVVEPPKVHLQKVKALHEQDLIEGYGEVYLPFALERKYPSASPE